MIHTTKIYFLHRGDQIPFYIGKTSTPFKHRIYRHKKKFGNNIQMEQLDEVLLDEWKFWESHYISLYKSWGFKLENKNEGGGGLHKHTEESRRKISNSLNNKTKEEINLIGERRRLGNLGVKRPGAGRTKWTKDQYDNYPNNRSIVMIDRETSNIIQSFNSITEASKIIGLSIGYICNICNKINNPKKGYLFRYKEDL